MADVYGVPSEGAPLDGLMFNRVSGDAFELIVAVAKTADLVIMPVGLATCLVEESQRRHLPQELRSGPVEVVPDGRALRAVIDRR